MNGNLNASEREHVRRVARREWADPKHVIADNVSVGHESRCWEWVRSRYAGYGKACFNGKIWQAHRLSFVAFVGSIPPALQVNHRCHNRACCNPDHLYLGTQVQNVADMDAAGRRNQVRGEKSPKARLTPEAVREIRSSPLPAKALRERFAVSDTLIRAVRNRLCWTHLP